MSSAKNTRDKLSVDRDTFWKTSSATNWDVQGHIDHVYDVFRFVEGRPPKVFKRENERFSAIQQTLMRWQADLGARDRMDWAGFLKAHQRLLQPLARVPSLGRLDAKQIDTVVDVVQNLEKFKKTIGRKLVFGSKAAHFHFPGTVPVVSSEVVDGLKVLEAEHGPEIAERIGAEGRLFSFSKPDDALASYRNYVSLGNVLMAEVDSRKFLGRRSSAAYDLNAKIVEWYVIGRR